MAFTTSLRREDSCGTRALNWLAVLDSDTSSFSLFRIWSALPEMVPQVLLTCASAPWAPSALWLLLSVATISAMRSLVALNSANESALPAADSLE